MSDMKSNLPQGATFDTTAQIAQTCQNCGSNTLSVFYAVDSIPIHSCLLMPTRTDALEYPKGNLHLAFCDNCGFVTNTHFDAGGQNYSAQYEETQGFSDRFNEFAEWLAKQMISRYNIHNKTILEIGCGKGEFLTLMCQLSNNRGIGIDPAYVPDRNPDRGAGRIEFIQDSYSEKYCHIKADVICCRHTLEHIAPTLKFMHTLRKAIGDRTNSLVFFEVPDVMRVLQEGAFWDIYYEHCSYFTAGSLARLFKATGFKIDDLYLAYDDQYVVITAYPTNDPHAANLDLENDMQSLTCAVEEFARQCRNRIDYWQSTIQEISDSGRKAVIWGSGSKGVAFLTTLKVTEAIKYVVDINPYRHGKFMPGTGQEIVSPQFLATYRPHKIIAMNPIYLGEIQKNIDRLDVRAELLTV